MTIGVLALQGDYDAHRAMLEIVAQELGAALRVVTVRDARALEPCDALVIPGGESTVMSRLCDRYELWEPLRARLDAGMGALGTCAGMILLARNIEGATHNFTQKTLGALDIDVARNAYGAQADSFETDIALPAESAQTEALKTQKSQAPLSQAESGRDENEGAVPLHEYARSHAASDEPDVAENARSGAPPETGPLAVGLLQETGGGLLRAVFIRAPRITRCGQNVEVLARHEGFPVVVRQGRIMAASFHPEIAGDARLHTLWLRSLQAG